MKVRPRADRFVVTEVESLMVRIPQFVVKVIGSLFVTLLLAGAPSIKGQQSESIEFNPTNGCAVVHLDDITVFEPAKLPSLTTGIRGLPCTASQEGPNTPKPDPHKLQRGFDYYSWLTFIALNSPAVGGPMGQDARTVWETYKQLPDVMREQGKKPEDWRANGNAPDDPPEACKSMGKLEPGTIIIHMELEETYNEPFKTGPLFDQNGNYALFGIFMNEQMFRYIANPNHPLYSREGQEAFVDEINFPSGNDTDKTLGAIMIKTSWKLLKEGVDFGPNLRSKYHLANGLLYRPKSSDPCRRVKLGLIGFHVGHKTIDRQQWIWTTFEHEDNVPTEQQVKDGISKDATFTFYDPKCDVSKCPPNQTPVGPWNPDTLGWVPFNRASAFKSQIVRTGPGQIFPGDDDVKKLNDSFHNWSQIKNTVWAKYNLINTQWPSGFPCSKDPHPSHLPDATCAPFPTFLANTTLETFSQPQQDAKTGVPLATSSCISCHNNATTQHDPATRSDFTYILEKAKSVHDRPN
jgi:hypothetical protein